MTLVSLTMFTQSSGIHRDANREFGATNAALEIGGEWGLKTKTSIEMWEKFAGSKRRRGKEEGKGADEWAAEKRTRSLVF